MIQPSESANSVQPFLAMQILERAKELEAQGTEVVHLEIGEPNFDVPECVSEEIRRALGEGDTHYTHSLGQTAFREAVASYYARKYGITIEPERVLATMGTSSALVLLMAYLLSQGDEVLIPNPGYACYPNFVRAFHGVPVSFPVRAKNAFQYDVSEIAQSMTPKTRAVFVNSPSNPTAAVQRPEVLKGLAQLGVPIISDEIYHGIEYDERARSMLEFSDEAFVVDGLSKRYAMTGLRIAWLVAPKSTVPTLQKLQQNLFVCASSLSQRGAIAALNGADDDLATMLTQYRERRDVLVAGLEELGLELPAVPEGAYYALAKTQHLSNDSLQLAKQILEEAHVGVTPGIDFGDRAEGYLRFSFATSLEDIRTGLDRLKNWLQDR